MTFEHYIITRFNLPVFKPKVDGAEVPSACDENYLNYRFGLFERYCLPSIKNQSCQNFKWLILMDARTPDKFKKRLETLHNEYDNLRPFYLNLDDYKRPYPQEYIDLYNEYAPVAGLPDYEHIDEDPKREIQHIITPMFIKDCIKQLSATEPDYLITTRIDNDDSFHRDAIAIVQKQFSKKPEHVVLDYPNTYKYILYENVVYEYSLLNNHFLTLVESSEATFQSAIYWNHLYSSKFVKTEHYYTKPLQVEMIHGNNVVNNFTEFTLKGLINGLFHFSSIQFGWKDERISRFRMLVMALSLIKKNIINYVRKNT